MDEGKSDLELFEASEDGNIKSLPIQTLTQELEFSREREWSEAMSFCWFQFYLPVRFNALCPGLLGRSSSLFVGV